MSAVGFLDVFVTFFTGQLSPDTGLLEPKKFFQRWISPGLVLQLLVNPKMGYVSLLVVRGWNELMHHGPVRVFRWTVALFYPVSQWVVVTTRESLCKYTAEQNRTVEHEVKEQNRPQTLGTDYVSRASRRVSSHWNVAIAARTNRASIPRENLLQQPILFKAR